MRSSSTVFKVVCVLVSGICWYLSLGLTGNFWYLQWLAPIPVLYVALNSKGWPAFGYVFTVYLIGRLSWLSYLLAVIPVMLAIMFTVLPALVFALLAATARKLVLRTSHWSAVLALPVLFTSFEYIMFLFSRDGTITSIAYSQSNFLPIVQVASLTGIQGITFLLSFAPFAIAVVLHRYQQKLAYKPLLTTTILVMLVVLGFGTWRLLLSRPAEVHGINVGLTVLDESAYLDIHDNNTAHHLQIAKASLADVPALAARTARVIVLPEKAILVNDSSMPVIQQMFAQAAVDNKVFIIAGVTKIKGGHFENNAWVFTDSGRLVADYKKVNLFEGEAAEGFTPGTIPSLFKYDYYNSTQGVAICKDMDYQKFILQYAKKGANVLYAPAWDFVQDGWLHSRMAVMRSVEGGYGLVRNARLGRLTVNNRYGQVTYETSCENKKNTTLFGRVILSSSTFYSKTGDWFSVLNLAASVYFIALLFVKKRNAARAL